MLDLRPVLFVLGLQLIILGASMFLPALVDFTYENEDWRVFMTASFATLFVGLALWLSNRDALTGFTIRQAFLLTTLSWVFLAAFGALPLYWSTLGISFSHAFFESMSGLTGTGATVLSGLDAMPPGILIWRAILHWFGGLGIIIMAIAVLPMLQVAGMQFFKVAGHDTSDKILPRAEQISSSLIAVYLILTGVCAFAFLLTGMNLLDAVIHAMSTIATGGFSSRDASMGYFSASAQWIAIPFMIIGALPFFLLIKAFYGSWGNLYRDQQVRFFLGLLFVASASIAAYHVIYRPVTEDVWEATRYAVFSVVSITTTTGFANSDYSTWGTFPTMVIFFLTIVGGCTGSTAAGIKIMRLQIMSRMFTQHAARVAYPNGVFNPSFNGQRLEDSVIASAMSFLFLYMLVAILMGTVISNMGVDPITALSGTVAILSNVGPGLGPIIGPAGNFGSLPESAIWLFSLGMMMGRVEFFVFLVLFLPDFWRN